MNVHDLADWDELRLFLKECRLCSYRTNLSDTQVFVRHGTFDNAWLGIGFMQGLEPASSRSRMFHLSTDLRVWSSIPSPDGHYYNKRCDSVSDAIATAEEIIKVWESHPADWRKRLVKILGDSP